MTRCLNLVRKAQWIMLMRMQCFVKNILYFNGPGLNSNLMQQLISRLKYFNFSLKRNIIEKKKGGLFHTH